MIPDVLRPVQRLMDLMSRAQDGTWTDQMAHAWAEAQRSVDGVLQEVSGQSGRQWTRVLRAAADSGIGDEDPTFDRDFLNRLVTFHVMAIRDLVPPMSAEREERLRRRGGRFGFSFE